MTEITDNNASRRYIIDPVAFFGALVGGPILFTAATFWILFIPVAALAIGGVPYLLIGAPVLMVHLRRHPADVGTIAWTAFLGFLALWAVIAVFIVLTSGPHQAAGAIGLSFIVLFFGAFFSAGWGATSGWLYHALARDFYSHAETC